MRKQLSNGLLAMLSLTFVACTKQNQSLQPTPSTLTTETAKLGTSQTETSYTSNNGGLGFIRFIFAYDANPNTVSFTNTSKAGNGYYLSAPTWDFGDRTISKENI